MRGDQRGRTIGFPTANLCTDNELLPPHGVYATTATVGGIVHAVGDQHRRAADRRRVRPRRSSRRTSSTSNADLYGAPLRVGFVQRLRDERAFESLDALRAQIDADCRRARVLFGRLSL